MPNPIFPGAQYSNPATVTVSSDAVSGSINEGATLHVTFTLDHVLPADTMLNVVLSPNGSSAADFGTITAQPLLPDSSPAAVAANVSIVGSAAGITIPAGAKSLVISVPVLNDPADPFEGLFVTGSQTGDGMLKDAWYVSSGSIAIKDVPAVTNTVNTTAGQDHLVGTAAVDYFNIGASSTAAPGAGNLDDVSGFTVGQDKIVLPSTLNVSGAAVSTLSTVDIKDEAGLISAWTALNDFYFPGGKNSVYVFNYGSDSYVVADANGDGIINSSGGTQDIVVKIVGATLTAGDLVAAAP